MKINIEKLVPNNWIVEQVTNALIRIYYINVGRGNSPKPFILPNIVLLDKEFIEGLSMYIGDGKLSKDLGHLEFTSIDEDMINFMKKFFKNKFNIKYKDFMFRKQAFQISGVILRTLFGKVTEKIYNSNFYHDKKLRRAFLRGLFAAEGGIGINRKENYIVYMAYHLSYEKEEKLANLVQSLLYLEGINSKQLTRKNKGERYIQITNWKNYYKCWKIGLFDLCQRKKGVFLNKIKKTNFFFKLKKEFIRKLLNSSGLSHRQISLKLGIRPETLCILNKGKTSYINKIDLSKLTKFNRILSDETRRNIVDLRVNRTTHINNSEFVDFILGL